MRIRDTLQRDLDQHIQEVIKVGQMDEATVYTELTEYVATASIREHYRKLLWAIAESKTNPTEDNQVWISGFFGSGKSSFAKNLGYALANLTVQGHSAAELFKQRLGYGQIDAAVDLINATIPTEIIMFDVTASRALVTNNELLAEIMYRELLAHLGYATDYIIADLEIELEHAGTLADFIARFESRYAQPWSKLRSGSQGISRASAILFEMEPQTYAHTNAWAEVAVKRPPIITINSFVDRCFELMALRRPGKALTFIIDEVGQYVARNSDKLEDLRATVETLAKEGRNRVRRKEAPAPIWTIVTSQERLNEVVDALGEKHVQIAKVQDRFSHRIDLEESDIREVATQRVLAKRPEAMPVLQHLYQGSRGVLETATRFEQSHRSTAVNETDFVRFYPYLPHFIDLSISIVSGIRLQPGADRHLGGSNRTIIKQSHEMLVSEQTHMADRPVGALVTLDLVYELVNNNLTGERRNDINKVITHFAAEGSDGSWPARVAKAMCLLEFVKDLPRTPTNIAAVLVDTVGQPSPVRDVEAALDRLESAQFVRRSVEGYKLQTTEEKSWDIERREHLETKQAERTKMLHEALRQIFSESSLKIFRYQGRTLQVGVTVEDATLVSEQQVPLTLLIAEDDTRLAKKIGEAQTLSRVPAHQNTIYWVFALDDDIDGLMKQMHASHWMIERYDHVSASEQINTQNAILLEGERKEETRLKERLRARLELLLAAGCALFQGTTKDASALGQTLPEIFKALFEFAIPTLYPYLAMGTRSLKGDEVEKLFRSETLHGLPAVFYEGEQGLQLIIKDANRYVPNRQAPIAQEILRYLNDRHEYGETVTGRDLNAHFTGLGYGWEEDVLRLVLAVLLRAGAIRLTYQGNTYTDYQAVQAQNALKNLPAYRSASFAPREQIDMRTLVAAAEYFEAITSRSVVAEEPAIAQALRQFALEETQLVLPVQAKAAAQNLPIASFLEDYLERVRGLQQASPDICVQTLSGEGKTLKTQFDRARRIRESLSSAPLILIQQARMVLVEQWPLLQAHGASTELTAQSTELHDLLLSETFYEQFERIRTLAEALGSAYSTLYRDRHAARTDHYRLAVEDLQGRREWPQLSEALHPLILASLTPFICPEADLADYATVCARCKATVTQLESDDDALTHRASQALNHFFEALAPPPDAVAARSPTRIRAAEFFDGLIDSDEAIESALERLRKRLKQLVAEGQRVRVE